MRAGQGFTSRALATTLQGAHRESHRAAAAPSNAWEGVVPLPRIGAAAWPNSLPERSGAAAFAEAIHRSRRRGGRCTGCARIASAKTRFALASRSASPPPRNAPGQDQRHTAAGMIIRFRRTGAHQRKPRHRPGNRQRRSRTETSRSSRPQRSARRRAAQSSRCTRSMRSWRSCASIDSVAIGRASRRMRLIGSPVSSQ